MKDLMILILMMPFKPLRKVVFVVLIEHSIAMR